MNRIFSSKPACRILLVAAHASERLRLGAILLGAGHSVHAAAGADEAVRLMHAAPADVAILELTSPDMPGVQLGLILREQFAPLPLLFVGDPPAGVMLRLLNEQPCVRLLPGPTRDELLLATLQAMFSESVARPAPPG